MSLRSAAAEGEDKAHDSDRQSQQRPKRQRRLATTQSQSAVTPQPDASAQPHASPNSIADQEPPPPPPGIISHSDQYGTYFTSPWSTEFLLAVASQPQWRGKEVYAEIPISSTSRCTDESIKTLPITNLPTGHHLLRIPGTRPLWFYARSAAAAEIAIQPALPEASSSSATTSSDEPPGSMPAPPEHSTPPANSLLPQQSNSRSSTATSFTLWDLEAKVDAENGRCAATERRVR